MQEEREIRIDERGREEEKEERRKKTLKTLIFFLEKYILLNLKKIWKVENWKFNIIKKKFSPFQIGLKLNKYLKIYNIIN